MGLPFVYKHWHLQFTSENGLLSKSMALILSGREITIEVQPAFSYGNGKGVVHRELSN